MGEEEEMDGERGSSGRRGRPGAWRRTACPQRKKKLEVVTVKAGQGKGRGGYQGPSPQVLDGNRMPRGCMG